MYVFVFLLVQDKEVDWKIDTYFIFGSVLLQGLDAVSLALHPSLSKRSLRTEK